MTLGLLGLEIVPYYRLEVDLVSFLFPQLRTGTRIMRKSRCVRGPTRYSFFPKTFESTVVAAVMPSTGQ